MERHSFWRTKFLYLLLLSALAASTTASPAYRRHGTTDVASTLGAVAAGAPNSSTAGRHRRPHRRQSSAQRQTPACYEDVPSKTYLASTVFDGKARSLSPIKNGVYNVTFVVQAVFKGGEAVFARSPIRLQFAEKKDTDPECPRPPGLVRANIRRGGKYVVFVDRVGPHSFVARGEPAVRSKGNAMAVRDGLAQYVRKPSLSGLSNATLKINDKLRLICKTRGNPLPLLQWYKDGARIALRPRDAVKIRSKKRRTTLVINRVSLQDAGHYECRATSVTGAMDRISSHITVLNTPSTDNTTTGSSAVLFAATTGSNLWRVGRTCPINNYCMNGGTCTYYDVVGELLCTCADGFKGTRCEEKDVFNGSMYRPRTYNCKLGISSSYYC